MGAMSIWHWLIALGIILLLFGAGKIPRLMGDVAKGVKAFKSGLKDEDTATDEPTPTVANTPIADKAKEPAMAEPAKKVSNG